jgi:hypothetical protein
VICGEIYCVKRAFRAGFFVDYCRMGDFGISSALAAYDNLLASGHRFGVCVHYDDLNGEVVNNADC